MEHSNTYLMVQSFRAQGLKQKEIQRLTGLSAGSVSAYVNNKVKHTRAQTENKVIKNLENGIKNPGRKSDKFLISSGAFIAKNLKGKKRMYDISRTAKRLSKSKDVFKELKLKYKKGEQEQFYKEFDNFYGALKNGNISIG